MLVHSLNGTHIKEANETGSKCINHFLWQIYHSRKCSVSVGVSYKMTTGNCKIGWKLLESAF